MATSNQELDSFLAKYKYLCSAGHKASLSFKSEKFCTRISLDVELPFMTPPWSLPPPSCVQTPTMSPTSLRHRSPSYYRRLKRRYDARQKVEEDSNSIVDFGKKVEEAAMLPKVVENAAEDILSKEKIGTNSSDGAEMLTEENAAALDHVESECEVDEKGEADGKIKHVLDANTGSEYDGIKSSINDVSDDTPVVNGRGDCNGIGGLSGCVVLYTMTVNLQVLILGIENVVCKSKMCRILRLMIIQERTWMMMNLTANYVVSYLNLDRIWTIIMRLSHTAVGSA